MSEGRLMILDIESYLFRACTTCEELAELEPFVYQKIYKLENGIDFINKTIDELSEAVKADDVVIVLGDKERNFRKELNTNYKAQRGTKPLMLDMLRSYVESKFQCAQLPSLEADDVARIVYEDNKNYPFETKIIVGIDKDFYSVPCLFYRDLPNYRTIEVISDEEATKNLMIQVISGDTADNYNGIPGYGKTRATKWANEKPRIWADVLKLFQDNGLGATDYAINKRMATLVGIKDYNFEKEEVL